jgi:cytochrome c biogenesis protein CcdA
MLALTLVVASIALADSVNPSTVVPALWIASAARGRGLLSYTVGVFAVYLAGGLLLVFGPGPALITALHHVRGPVEHAVEAIGGVVALAFAIWLWCTRGRQEGEPRRRGPQTHASAFGLGAGIMAIELPTAFMYFGAISAILAAHHPAAVEIALLLVYNTLFVAPLVAIVAVRRLAGERAERWLASGRTWLRRAGQVVLTGAAGAAGTGLLVTGVTGLLAA